ncbi:hypothetical protein E6H22_03840, partial [Candidatus Bathyarchaeota archaeon]
MPIRIQSKYSPRKTIRGKTSTFVPSRTLHSFHAQYRILIVNLPRLDPRISLRRLRNSVRTAVVLSGGEGIRLLPITKDLPKGLVKVGGKPLLQWVVEWLRENGVTSIVMGVAYLKDHIINYFGNGDRFGVEIKYSIHTVQGGTGEGF